MLYTFLPELYETPQENEYIKINTTKIYVEKVLNINKDKT